jgi:group I intron endonuclease
MRKQVGIYQITNTANGCIYIGSSLNMDSRLKGHIVSLKHNHHDNTAMQADANHYGVSVFVCSILETMPDTATDEEITEREQHHTDQAYKSGKCYNHRYTTIRRDTHRRCQICGERHYSKNMCEYHWARWKRYAKTQKDIRPDDYIAYVLKGLIQ